MKLREKIQDSTNLRKDNEIFRTIKNLTATITTTKGITTIIEKKLHSARKPFLSEVRKKDTREELVSEIEDLTIVTTHLIWV